MVYASSTTGLTTGRRDRSVSELLLFIVLKERIVGREDILDSGIEAILERLLKKSSC